MSPTLPVETIENAVSFLRDDTPSLAACSLTCRALLPVSRIYLWDEVVLPFELDGSHSARTKRFLGVLDKNQAIAAYIRSVVVCPRPEFDYIDGPKFAKAAWDTLSARLPAVRSLRLRDCLLPNLSQLVSLICDRPTLEALILDNVGIIPYGFSTWPRSLARPTATAADGQSSRYALRTLSVFGNGVSVEELSRLALLLERSTEVLSLEVLDLCCHMAPPQNPNRPDNFPGIPSYGPSLRHFGISLRDTMAQQVNDIDPEGRQHLRSVISGLRQCRSLRSLHLVYERTGAYMIGVLIPPTRGAPLAYRAKPFFLELLADVLSAPGLAPLPLLESLTLVFGGPPAWLVGFEAAFARLAGVLTGNSGDAQGTAVRRYPRFSRLDVRTTSLKALGPFFEDAEMAALRYRQAADRVHLALPMFASFVKAGVHVEVTCV